MYLGRARQGDEILLRVHSANRTTAIVPAAAPRVTVYDASGAVVARGLAYQADRPRSPTLFQYRLFLASATPPGRYLASFTFADGTAARTLAACFDVIAGDAAGAVVSMAFVRKPHADSLIQKTASGRRFLKRTPYV